MIIFTRLILAHLLTDFVIFRRHLFDIKKENRFWGYSLHFAIFAALTLILCWPYMGMVWVNFLGITLNGWQTLPFLAAAHTATDIACKTTAGRLHTFLFVLWQIVCVSILFLAFPVLSAQQVLAVNEHWETFLIIAAGAVFVTFFIKTLNHFIEKDLYGEYKPMFDVNYANMLIRLALYLLLLAPCFWGLALGALWVGFVLITSKIRGFDISPVRLYIALPLAAIAGAVVRYFIYYA